jgi:hypothetical protein
MYPHTATAASTSGLEAAAVTITGITTMAVGTTATGEDTGKVAAAVDMVGATAAATGAKRAGLFGRL